MRWGCSHIPMLILSLITSGQELYMQCNSILRDVRSKPTSRKFTHVKDYTEGSISCMTGRGVSRVNFVIYHL